MTGHSEAADGTEGDREALDRQSVPRSRPTLRSAVVRYDARPDRRTVRPPTATDAELVTAWLSADASAFVSLAEMR